MLDGYLKFVRRTLPSPFSIAIILSIVTLVAVFFYVQTGDHENNFGQILGWWQEGLWTPNLLVFAVQMMLMLVLGHVVALSPIMAKLIDRISSLSKDASSAAAIVAFFTLIVGYINWGLGLIFGAILARKVGEYASKNSIPINYALVGAAGYAALMIWHGGLSGSALIKVAEPGHLSSLMEGSSLALPSRIGMNETTFHSTNILICTAIVLIIPIVLYALGKFSKSEIPKLSVHPVTETQTSTLIGAEHIDYSNIFSRSIGGLLGVLALYKMFIESSSVMAFLTPNNINFLLLSIALVTHKNIMGFLKAVEQAIVGASGILIQFPIYFGIMGLMKESGLVAELSRQMVSISSPDSFPVLTYISAGLVNIFVPSGGGQWAIQGPILIEASAHLEVPLNKSIMALAYGDQITNMLQPFWALPLLGITKLSAKDILPYSLVMFLVGFAIYLIGILAF